MVSSLMLTLNKLRVIWKDCLEKSSINSPELKREKEIIPILKNLIFLPFP